MPAAPTSEIGYAQATNAGFWMYDDETTPELVWPQSVTVYDAMRSQDSQVRSVLQAVTNPVLSTRWWVDPAGARDEVAEFVARDLGLPLAGADEPPKAPRTRDRFSWLEYLRHALLMLPFGYMYFEQVYRVDPDGSRAHLRKLAPRMPKTIQSIDVASDGGLISITQYSSMTERAQRPIPVDRLVAHVNEREGGNWLGRSLLRSCYKNWLLKDRLLRVQAQTVERNGMGVPLYKGAPGETDLTKGARMAQAWRAGEASGAAIPNEADMLLLGVEGELPDADKPIRYHDEQIARGVLAHFLNLGTQTGSWALGTTFADFFTLSLQNLAQAVKDTATQHVVEDLVDINFGDDEPAPKIACAEIGSRQQATAAELKALIDSGALVVDDELEAAIRQMYGMPRRDPATARPPKSPTAADPSTTPDEPGRPGSVAARAKHKGSVQPPLPGLDDPKEA
jgi:hypothetical protein